MCGRVFIMEIKFSNIILFVMLNLIQHLASIAQNLIPNGDFEYYTSCPNYFGQLNRAFPWYDPNNSTSDYYNACANDSFAGVPCQSSCANYQIAHSGNGYAGLGFADQAVTNYREYIQVKLNDSLINNRCYYIEFYVNLINYMPEASNNIGAYISTTAITCPMYQPYNLVPNIVLPGNPVITDTVNWVKVYGLYSANGGEDYITIGNFAYDSNTVFQTIVSGGNSAYYYVDDVSMYEIKTSGVAGRDTTICHGDSVQLGVANYEGVSYSWQPAAGLSNASVGNPYAKPLVTTTYYLTQTTPCAVTLDTVLVTLGNCYIGINEITKENTVNIIPNPATNQFTIENSQLRINAIHIYNVLGEEVLKLERIANSEKAIDISTWKAGVYFVEVETEKGVVRKKVVKE